MSLRSNNLFIVSTGKTKSGDNGGDLRTPLPWIAKEVGSLECAVVTETVNKTVNPGRIPTECTTFPQNHIDQNVEQIVQQLPKDINQDAVTDYEVPTTF